MNKKLLVYACMLIFFIWLVNTVANSFYWYSAMWWFDIPMHVLGGIFLGLCAGSLFFSTLLQKKNKEIVVVVLLLVLLVGVGWEVFEYVVQFVTKGKTLARVPDSMKDLLMDLVGGAIALVFVLRALKRYNITHAHTSIK